MRRLAYIDVLRGIAILAVVVHHLPGQFADVFGRLQQFGGRGVDLFFVLSGFLIGSTTLTRAGNGTPISSAKAYWLLRTVRIWPLYFGLLALYAAQIAIFDPEVGRILREHAAYYVFFFSNDLGQPTLELGILWSLAIEEQFYLAVGFLVLFTSHKRETLAAAFVALGFAAIAVSLRTRFDLFHLQSDGVLEQGTYVFKLYFSTLSRIDQLGLGLLAAVAAPWINTKFPPSKTTSLPGRNWAAVFALVAVLVFVPQIPRFEFLLVGIAFGLVVLLVQRPDGSAGETSKISKLSLSVIGGIGKLSYGFYLFHPFVRAWLVRVHNELNLSYSNRNAVVFTAVWVGLCWGLAWVSYRLIEEPLLHWARERAARLIDTPEQQTLMRGTA